MSCKKASLLIDKKLSSKLTILDWLNLKLHVTMCDMCAHYYKQSHLIDKLIKSRMKDIRQANEKEVNELKDRIRINLNKRQ